MDAVDTIEILPHNRPRRLPNLYEPEVRTILRTHTDARKSIFNVKCEEISYIWQEVCFGKNPVYRDDKLGNYLFRAYVMVEEEDIFPTVNLLNKIGKQELSKGYSTCFKWLAGVAPEYVDVDFFANSFLGNYFELEDDDPRIAIYGRDLDDTLRILHTLCHEPSFEKIDMKRRKKPRYPGANIYIDEIGKEWRSLNFNDEPGHAYQYAQDPDWREKRSGTSTLEIESYKYPF